MQTDKILVIGANGQIGTVLLASLRDHYGDANVIASDIRAPAEPSVNFVPLDALNRHTMSNVVRENGITQIYMLAAILSAKGEQNPLQTWDINMTCLFNALEVCREHGVKKLFYPSTIAVFGPDTPRIMTPQNTIRNPTTVYGISKVAGENWCNYYHGRYGLDVRSVRYPGIIGYQSLPGGGTTDYAVDIFHQALAHQQYTCFLSANTGLPMMYMEDAIRATIEIMEAPSEKVKFRSSYNLAGMSFTPAEIAAEIKQHIPNFEMRYEPDFRQAIAESWPQSIDDSAARADWGWQPRFNLSDMVADMLAHLG